MDNFDLRKYLAEGRLFEEDKPVWTIEGWDDSPNIEQADKGYVEAVVSYIKAAHPDISDEDLKKSMEVAEETWYNEGRENAKSGEGEDFKVSVEEFADGAIEYYEDALMPEPDDSKGWTPPANDDFDYWFNFYKEDFPGTMKNDEGKVITDEKYKKAFINYVQKEIKPKFTDPSQINNAILLFKSKMAKDYGMIDWLDEPDFDLKKYLTEGHLLKEENSVAVEYLKNAFQMYLEGGDTFEGAPGDIEILVLDGEEYGDSENYDNADQFRATLQALTTSPISLQIPEYGKVTFKRKEDDIIGSFIVPEQ